MGKFTLKVGRTPVLKTIIQYCQLLPAEPAYDGGLGVSQDHKRQQTGALDALVPALPEGIRVVVGDVIGEPELTALETRDPKEVAALKTWLESHTEKLRI